MKRLRSYGDDLGSAGEKDLDRTTSFSSSHHRRFYSKAPENGRSRPSPSFDDDRDREGSSRGLSLRKRGEHDFGDSSFDDREMGVRGGVIRKRFDPDLEGFDDREGPRGLRKRGDHDFSDNFDDREGSRGLRKRLEHDADGFERRKGFDRYRDRDVGVASSLTSPRGGYVGDRERERDRERDRDRDRERIHRSESFCVSRRDFPKGFRSERHWSRREDSSSSSWRRFDTRNKKDVEEDAKSSPAERGGSSSSTRCGLDFGGATSRERLRSPQGIKDGKSPTWSKDSTKDSKDSEGEASKDTKKNESMVVESAGSAGGRRSGSLSASASASLSASVSASASASEMEEGELQPELLQRPPPRHLDDSKQDLASAAEGVDEDKEDMDAASKPNVVQLTEMAESGKDISSRDGNLAQEGKKEVNKEIAEDEKQLMVVDVAHNEVAEETETSSPCQTDSLKRVSVDKEVERPVHEGSEDAAAKDEDLSENQAKCSPPIDIGLENQCEVEEPDPTSIHKSSPQKENAENNFDLEVGLDVSNKAFQEEIQKELEPCANAVKDKGKGVAVDEISPRENSLLIERNFIACRDDAMEGPSTRGFELFSSSAGFKADSAKQTTVTKAETEKLKLEPLDLSLGLPNVSVPAASNSTAVAPPTSPPRARSVQSLGTTFRTGSDCFTTSISFSGSQFVHNPSCSLTHNSVDYDFEQSVKSRPLFQGVDWQALNANDSLPKEVLINQKLASNGNGSLHLSHAPHGMLNGRATQPRQGTPSGLDWSASFQRQLSGKVRHQDDPRSPALSAGSQDNRSEFGMDKKRAMGEESVSRLFRSSSQREQEQGLVGERDRVERIIYLIVSEQIQAMAWRVHELPERSVFCLKDAIREIIVKEDNRGKLFALQEVLRKRSDLNLETLLKSHRAQLQILVAIKTGLPEFVQCDDGFTSSDLAEIFLNLKCRNVNCGSALPVDDCDCRFCSRKDGFCSTCMCLVCSKFDTASNTCGWVGCDVCNHWCHTNCGLLKSYIRNGRSASGAMGVYEMQFYCLACEHPSEMFGFVKDVFKSCATEWKADTLLKELEFVKKIFSPSNDTRGRLLHDAAKQLLVRLQSGANDVEVYNQIMKVLNESDSNFGNAVGPSSRELQFQPQVKKRDIGSSVAALAQEAIWSKPIPAKEISRVENVGITLPATDGNSSAGGNLWKADSLLGAKKPDDVDELDSIIKIKQAEAQMFQKRANDARREAEGLKRIAIAKSEKIEEEYASRMAKLGLSEVEERRRQKLEELQMLERSHREYFNMKTRMEADIKDLLLKMEATRRNLST